MPQGIDPAVQSRCLVLYHAWLVGFACAVSPTGLCMKAFLFQFDSFSAAWVPIYLPVLTRASDGFFAFSGIIQYAPAFCAPVMRPSPQRATTRRLERCQRSAASIAEMYFMPYIVYTPLRLYYILNMEQCQEKAAVLQVFICEFSSFKNRGGANRRPCTVCVSVFRLYFCFFFFSVTAVPITAPPLTNNSAIHSMRLLLSPVGGDFGSFAVTVLAFLISLVPSLSL